MKEKNGEQCLTITSGTIKRDYSATTVGVTLHSVDATSAILFSHFTFNDFSFINQFLLYSTLSKWSEGARINQETKD